MKGERITVCVFGKKGEFNWTSGPAPDFEEKGYTVVHYETDDLLNQAINAWNPHIFVTFDPWQNYRTLSNSSFEIRKRWIDGSTVSHDELGKLIIARYMELVLTKNFENPKISIFTAACNSKNKIFKPLNSIIGQTYKNWEWIIVDDSPDMENFKNLESIASFDHRIRVFKPHVKSGRIGEVKRQACGLATGDILVEIDHDDEFTTNCLEWIVAAFKAHPEAGFAYTDCCEVWEENGENFEYAPGWGLGFGSYRDEVYKDRLYRVMNYPEVNAKSIRHIVGCPNHARAWKRSVYEKIGGFNPEVHVADDYELMLRTFLYTRMIHIKKFGYIQYKYAQSQTYVRNYEIQRLVRYFREYYDQAIHARCLQLSDPDLVWTGTTSDINLGVPSDFKPLSLSFP